MSLIEAFSLGVCSSAGVLNVCKLEDLIDDDVMHGINGLDLPPFVFVYCRVIENRTVGRPRNEATSYVLVCTILSVSCLCSHRVCIAVW